MEISLIPSDRRRSNSRTPTDRRSAHKKKTVDAGQSDQKSFHGTGSRRSAAEKRPATPIENSKKIKTGVLTR